MNKYLVKIAQSEKLENPNYVRAGGRAILEGIGGNFVGGISGGIASEMVYSAAKSINRLGTVNANRAARALVPVSNALPLVGKLTGITLGVTHGWKASRNNQLREQRRREKEEY